MCFLLISNQLFSQQRVENNKYDLMLEKLLSHNVNEVAITDLANDSNIVYLDARSKNEYDVSHIENAIWVGCDKFKMKTVEGISKDRKIVVYCSVGYRSEIITQKLNKSGFKNVSNLYGGIFEWVNQQHKVYNNNGVTNNVHVYNEEWGVWLQKGTKVLND